MKKLKETKNHITCDAPRLLQGRELRQVDGGVNKLSPYAVLLPVHPKAPLADW